jgi:hypothetical protein
MCIYRKSEASTSKFTSLCYFLTETVLLALPAWKPCWFPSRFKGWQVLLLFGKLRHVHAIYQITFILYWSQLAQKKRGAGEVHNREAMVRLCTRERVSLLQNVQTVLGDLSASVQWVTAAVILEWSGCCVKLATQFHLEVMIRMKRAISPLTRTPPSWSEQV